MNVILEATLGLLLFSCGAHLFYWGVVRPVLLDICKSRAAQLLLDIEETYQASMSSPEDRGSVVVFREMCRFSAEFTEIDAVDIWMAMRREPSVPGHSPNDFRRVGECERLTPLVAAHTNIVLGVILINSPFVLPVFAFLYTGSLWFARARAAVDHFRSAVATATATPHKFA